MASPEPTRGDREDEPYGANGYTRGDLMADLRNSWERLCRASTHVPAHWQSDLQAAIDHIEEAGSALLPESWSRYRQPEGMD
jgi:hypothetical protein